MHVGDHWGLSGYEKVRGSIKVTGDKTYYPFENEFISVPENSDYCTNDVIIPGLTSKTLELRIEVEGHGSDYKWTVVPDEWQNVASYNPLQTEGQDTNNNGKDLWWKFTPSS